MKKYILISLIWAIMSFSLGSSSGISVSSDRNANLNAVSGPMISRQQVDTIANVIWMEARGESFYGKKAVATVIWNRAGGDSSKFVEVVKADSWTGVTYRIPTECYNGYDDATWDLAHSMFMGKFKPISDYTHFYNPSLAKPDWRKSLKKRTAIGNHIFGVEKT